MVTAPSPREFKKLLHNALWQRVWFFGLSFAGPGAGLDNVWETLPTQNILRIFCDSQNYHWAVVKATMKALSLRVGNSWRHNFFHVFEYFTPYLIFLLMWAAVSPPGHWVPDIMAHDFGRIHQSKWTWKQLALLIELKEVSSLFSKSKQR